MSEQTPILEFRDVEVMDPHYPSEALRDVTFSLHRGASLVIRPRLAIHEEEGGLEVFPLADCAEGLLPCQRGTVLFEGREWREYSLREQWRARARIGRVFAFHAWVHNLTVMENLTLAGRFHQLATDRDLEQRAREWARRFGLGDVPSGRPGYVKKAELRRLEWARALLTEPTLLLLEFPEMDAPRGTLPLLVQAVDEASGRGAAVLWITDDFQLIKELCAKGALLMEASGGRLKSSEENRV